MTILIDANVPMYLIGEPHPHKRDAQQLIEDLIARQAHLVTDAEVLQEILHRYYAIHRIDAMQPAFDLMLSVVDEVLPIERSTVQLAKKFLQGKKPGSARDAIHAAVMEQHQIDWIFSFDRDFDRIPGIRRIWNRSPELE